MRGWGSHRSARRSMRFQLRRRVRWLRRRSALSQCLVTRQRKPRSDAPLSGTRSSCSARAGRWPASVPGRGSRCRRHHGPGSRLHHHPPGNRSRASRLRRGRRGRHGLGHHHHAPAPAVPTPGPAAPQRRDRPDTQPWTRLTDAPTEPPRLARQLCRISSRQESTERIMANLENHRRAAALADGIEPPDMDGILFVELDLAVDHIA